MRPAFFVVVLIVLLPVSFASTSDRSIILIYDRSGIESFASRLAEVLQPVFGESEVWLTRDPELFNSIAFLPQVKMLLVLVNKRDVSLNAEVVEWFFDRGGSVLGNFDAGVEGDSGVMASHVFPVYANTSTTGSFNRQTRRYEMTYVKKDAHEVTEDLPDRFKTLERRMVIRWNERVREAVRILPPTGTLSDIYVEESNGFPLVILYEEEGRSAFFSSLDPPSNLSKLLDDANYSRLLSNVVEWLLRWDKKSSVYSVSTFKDAVSSLVRERFAAQETARRIRKRESQLRTGVDIFILAFSAAGAWSVYRFFVRGQGGDGA